MSALFELPIDSETLTPEEIGDITGSSRKNDQIHWLSQNGWTFHKNKAGEPIVGRLYARLKLAGITPAKISSPAEWAPDFSTFK